MVYQKLVASANHVILSSPPHSSFLSADCYVSADGKKIINIVLREEGRLVMRVVRGVVKVQPGDQGARAGLVFLFNQDPTEGDVMERLEQYDGWGAEDYQRLQRERYCHRTVRGHACIYSVCVVHTGRMAANLMNVLLLLTLSRTKKRELK